MKNSRSHLLMKKKKIALPASKALITSYFLNIKGFLGSPFYFRCFSYMSGQSLYYAHVLSFSYCGLQISWDIWYGGSEGSDDLLFSLILLPWNISATMFFHLPPLSGTMLFIFFDDYLDLKKTNFKEIYQYIYILRMDFWANLFKYGPFLYLKLGLKPTMAQDSWRRKLSPFASHFCDTWRRSFITRS